MGDNEQNANLEYMDVNNINQTAPTDTRADIDGCLLPTLKSESYSTLVTTASNVTENDVRTTGITHINIQDIDHQYMDMNIAYQRSASGSNFDVDGYLLPGVTSADADQKVGGYLPPSVTPSKSEVIPIFRAISTGLPGSDNEGSVKGTLRSNRQDVIHEYMDIKSVYQESSSTYRHRP